MLETAGKQGEHSYVGARAVPAPSMPLLDAIASLGERIATLIWLVWGELTGSKRPLI